MKRKILSALLSAAMVLGLCGSVFAAESVENARADSTPPPDLPSFSSLNFTADVGWTPEWAEDNSAGLNIPNVDPAKSTVLQKVTPVVGEPGYFIPFHINWNEFDWDRVEDEDYWNSLADLFHIQVWESGRWRDFSGGDGLDYYAMFADENGVLNENLNAGLRFRIVDGDGNLAARSQVKGSRVKYNEAGNYFYFDTSIYTLEGASSSSSSSSSGGSSVSESTAPASSEAPAEITTAQAQQQAEQAIDKALAADENASSVVVKVRNADSITPAALRAIASVASLASPDPENPIVPVVHADVVKDGKVESRLYIDPTQVTGNTSIKLGVTLGDQKVEEKFDKYFDNELVVVKFDQEGSFGMNIKVATKVDLSKLNTKSLVFYTYNAKTNTYVKIAAPAYYVDANGYLHFTTSMGNNVIITDKPLTRR